MLQACEWRQGVDVEGISCSSQFCHPAHMLLRRAISSFLFARSHLAPPRSASPDPQFARLKRCLDGTSLRFGSEGFGTPRTASSHGMGDVRRTPYIPLPPPDADKAEIIRGLEASLGSSFGSDPLVPPSSPLILVISGPSGVGKDAVIKRLREVREGIHFVVTATSREKRPEEVDGKDYFFVTKEEFLSMIERNELLEYALVYGEYKGIPKKQIRDFMARGFDIVLRVDIQGAATLRSILGRSAIFIFLTAESEEALVSRLVERRTETPEMLLVRVATAREEVKHTKEFDYVVVNAQGKLEEAVGLVQSIIDAEKARVRQRRPVI